MRIKLSKVEVNKYKSIQKRQTVEIEPSITTIVGMNESGKTNFLEAIAKTNYFNDDADFKFNQTQDFPRNQLVDFENEEEDEEIITCTYEISKEYLDEIGDEFGKEVFITKSFTYRKNYKNVDVVSGLTANQKKYLQARVEEYELSRETKDAIGKLMSLKEVTAIEKKEGDGGLDSFKAEVKKIVDYAANSTWQNPLEFYIYSNRIKPNMPKFWYFDEYYHLGGKVNINEVSAGTLNEKSKTAKALFELARIKPNEILANSDYERFIALLEASSNKITNEIFKYWSTRSGLINRLGNFVG